jgi:hypothetical protein
MYGERNRETWGGIEERERKKGRRNMRRREREKGKI